MSFWRGAGPAGYAETKRSQKETAMIRFAIALVLALSSVAAAQTTPTRKAWTILVYGAADNNADGPILEFLDSVRKAIDDDPAIDLLLLIDRHDKYSRDAKMLGADFTGARLFRLRKASAERLDGGSHFPNLTREKDEEIDSADAANIGKFIAWGKEVSPAERYALMIYSHANGRTMCPDEKPKQDMGIPELTEKVGAECRVDFLALELCTMGGIEIAYQWRPQGGRFSADVLLAIPNAGPPLDWDRAFLRIRSKGHDTTAMRPPLDAATMTAAEFGSLVIEEGLAGREASSGRGGGGSYESAACYDLQAAGAVKDAVDALARALAGSDAAEAFLGLRAPGAGAIIYERGGPFVDLYDVARRASGCQGLSQEAREAAKVVMQRTDAFVIDSFGMDGYRGFEAGRNGVFITLPRRETWKNMKWYTPEATTGAKDFGRWSFLRDGAKPGDGVVDNWFELLDTWLDESGLEKSGGGINGYRP
jgi:clostripain